VRAAFFRKVDIGRHERARNKEYAGEGVIPGSQPENMPVLFY